MILSASQIRQYAANAGFTGSALDTITQIALAESGGNPYATNFKGKDTSYGLTQINAQAWGPIAASAYGDPQQALNLAYSISNQGSNFSPWSTFTNGSYQNFSTGADGSSSGGSSLSFAPDTLAAIDPNAGTPFSLFGSSGPGSAAQANPGDVSPMTTIPGSQADCTMLDNAFCAAFPSLCTHCAKPGQPAAPATSWWSDFYTRVGSWFQRFFVVLLGIIMVGIGLWALNKGKLELELPKGLRPA